MENRNKDGFKKQSTPPRYNCSYICQFLSSLTNLYNYFLKKLKRIPTSARHLATSTSSEKSGNPTFFSHLLFSNTAKIFLWALNMWYTGKLALIPTTEQAILCCNLTGTKIWFITYYHFYIDEMKGRTIA